MISSGLEFERNLGNSILKLRVRKRAFVRDETENL